MWIYREENEVINNVYGPPVALCCIMVSGLVDLVELFS